MYQFCSNFSQLEVAKIMPPNNYGDLTKAWNVLLWSVSHLSMFNLVHILHLWYLYEPTHSNLAGHLLFSNRGAAGSQNTACSTQKLHIILMKSILLWKDIYPEIQSRLAMVLLWYNLDSSSTLVICISLARLWMCIQQGRCVGTSWIPGVQTLQNSLHN